MDIHSTEKTVFQLKQGPGFNIFMHYPMYWGPHMLLTQGGWMMHICVSKLTIIGSDNGLSPERRQATIWTNARILLITTLGTNFSEILSEIHTFSFKKMHLKTSPVKGRPFCLGLNVFMSNAVYTNGCTQLCSILFMVWLYHSCSWIQFI